MVLEQRVGWLICGVVAVGGFAGSTSGANREQRPPGDSVLLSDIQQAFAGVGDRQQQLFRTGHVAALATIDRVVANLTTMLALDSPDSDGQSSPAGSSTDPHADAPQGERSVLVQGERHAVQAQEPSKRRRGEAQERYQQLRANVERANAKRAKTESGRRREQSAERRADDSGAPAERDHSRRATPHPRVLYALKSQQKQLDKLRAQVERLDRQLAELKRRPLSGDTQAPKNIDRVRRESREPEDEQAGRAADRARAMRGAEQAERRHHEAERRAAHAEQAKLAHKSAELARKMQEIAERHLHTQMQLGVAKRRAENAAKEVKGLTQELERIEQHRAQLKQWAEQTADAAKQHHSQLKKIEGRRQSMERAMERRESREGGDRRSARKLAIPSDAI